VHKSLKYERKQVANEQYVFLIIKNRCQRCRLETSRDGFQSWPMRKEVNTL
jgi:hypothetical protein